jgi:hypothetical protein
VKNVARSRCIGVATTDIGTYWSVFRPDGSLFGEGHGIITGQGGESATWIGNGVGRLTGKGTAVAWRGAIYYQSTAPQWARLNGMAVIFEYETDENGNTTARLWEWK